MNRIKNSAGIIFLLTAILLSFSCEKEVSVSPPDPPVNTGMIYIDSSPRGADIYLNGKNTGSHTPDTLKWLEGTDYKITLKNRFFRDTTFTVRIDEKVKQDVFVDYFQNPSMYGKIQCESDPKNAEIYLDGQSTGRLTPFIFEKIAPGSHQVTYRYPGCLEDSLKINVESSTTRLAYLKLKDTTFWVTYNTSNSGIPTDKLTSILIDRNDIKWIGTGGKGVVRFDGRNFQIFNSGNSPLPNDYVTAMVLDQNDHLWIGTNKGLAEFDGSSWNVYNSGNSPIPDDFINAVCTGRNNVIWVGTAKGLLQFDGSWKLFNSSNTNMPGNAVQRLATEFRGKVWAGIQSVGLATFDGSKWESFTKENTGLPGHNVTALAVGQFSEGVWANFVSTTPRGTDEGGLAVKSNGTWINNYYSKLPTRIINSFMIAGNTIWACTDAGLIKFSTPSIWTVLNTSNTQLPSNIISAVSQDSHSTMWIATAISGLVKYKAK